MFQQTTALTKIASLNKRLRVIQGGTSAGKTIAILLYLINLAQTEKVSISIVSESVPHLKRGAMRDFLNIMQTHGYYKATSHNKTDMIYTFETGAYIEFFSADDPAKMRGARRDVLFINECNNVSFESFNQLEVRTKRLVILDFNPVSEFWVHEQVMPHMDHDFLKITYLDNEALDAQIVASIESRKHNESWWRVYGLGEIGFNEGQVYKNWMPIESVPEEARLERHGLDFGYTNDPTGIVNVYKWNNALILDEVAYASGLENKPIANLIRMDEGLDPVDDQNKFTGETKVLTIADSSEPKSIAEIKRLGVKITGAVKGQGSVNYGIQKVQAQTIYVTKSSLNIWKEQRNYLWKVDRDGKSLNIPEDDFNHLMDAARYAIVELLTRRKVRAFSNKPSGF